MPGIQPAGGAPIQGSAISFIVSKLKSVDLLADCQEFELIRLAESCRWQTFRPGQFLFYESSEAPGLHIIVAGKVHIQRQLRFGDSLTIVEKGPGEFVGELSLIDGSPASASVVASTEVQAIILRPVAFRELLGSSHKTCMRLMEILALRLRTATESIATAHAYSVKDRLALLLLDLAEPTPKPDCLKIELPSSQRELGERIGATRESINKSLAELVGAGILAPTSAKRVYLADRARLLARVQKS